MFPCCDCCYEKYLKQEPGNPVCQDSLNEINRERQARGAAPLDKVKLCRCICHVIGLTVIH